MKNEPTKQERRFLALAQNYMNDPVNENGEFPSHFWFEQMLDLAKPRVTYLKQSLISKGYLKVIQGRVILAEKAIQLLQQNPKIKEVRVAQIQLLGQVSAGTKSGQELVAYTRDAEDYSAKSIAIPEVKPNAKIIALEVKGDSMESEGIFENDIVIVELTPNKVPRENTLIIAKYLLRGESIDIDPLRGPTQKFIKGNIPWKIKMFKNIKLIKNKHIRG
jgi:SOS-response transcriptional repressor LexA